MHFQQFVHINSFQLFWDTGFHLDQIEAECLKYYLALSVNLKSFLSDEDSCCLLKIVMYWIKWSLIYLNLAYTLNISCFWQLEWLFRAVPHIAFAYYVQDMTNVVCSCLKVAFDNLTECFASKMCLWMIQYAECE